MCATTAKIGERAMADGQDLIYHKFTTFTATGNDRNYRGISVDQARLVLAHLVLTSGHLILALVVWLQIPESVKTSREC